MNSDITDTKTPGKLFINILSVDDVWCNGLAVIQRDEDYDHNLLNLQPEGLESVEWE